MPIILVNVKKPDCRRATTDVVGLLLLFLVPIFFYEMPTLENRKKHVSERAAAAAHFKVSRGRDIFFTTPIGCYADL